MNAIADSVNPIKLSRDLWAATAHATGADLLEVWITCSDKIKHRHRVEHRAPDITGMRLPDWDTVRAREFEPWPSADLTLDTAHVTPDEAVEAILSKL